MKYVVVDFEWNQPLPKQSIVSEPIPFESEIIEIGAIRLSDRFEFEAEYKEFIRPAFYPVMNGNVVRLTKIRPQDLKNAPPFSEVCQDFLSWCGEEFCLCTWGSDDVPAFLDNMLIHGLQTPAIVRFCNLQHIYGREIMRDEGLWALEKAVDLLSLPKERAHDALNDARNTLKICERVDIFPYARDYASAYIDYGKDRINGLYAGKTFFGLDEAQQDPELTNMNCPYCGEKIQFGEWERHNANSLFGYSRCSEGDEFLASFRTRRLSKEEWNVGRTVFEMNNVLWDDFQSDIERNAEWKARHNADSAE